MHARRTSTRIATSLGACLLLVAISAGAAAAGTPRELITISIDFPNDPTAAATERFVTSSPLLCPSGDAFTDFMHGSGNDHSRAASFHLTKLLVCDDGSGSFRIRVDAASNFVVGDGTVGGWSVVPGSGIGAYTGLVGGGNVVGNNIHEGDIDLVDHYFGSLRR